MNVLSIVTLLKNTVSIDFLLNWTGTAAVIAATCIRAIGSNDTNIIDLSLTGIGCMLWAISAYRIKNRALLTVNVFSGIIVAFGIIRHVF